MEGKEELLVQCSLPHYLYLLTHTTLGANIQSTNRLTNLDLTKPSRDLHYELLIH